MREKSYSKFVMLMFYGNSYPDSSTLIICYILLESCFQCLLVLMFSLYNSSFSGLSFGHGSDKEQKSHAEWVDGRAECRHT